MEKIRFGKQLTPENKMHLIVFKTSVVTQKQAGKLLLLLNALPLMVRCNFDLDDCDHILRVVCIDLQPQIISRVLHTEGFKCEIMESFVYAKLLA